MRDLRAIVFDFDGVIVESLEVKTRAFRNLLPGRPALQDRLEQYHLRHLGMSRYEKFAWMYRELLRRPLPPGEMAALDRRFRAAIAGEMRSCAFVPGALDFLRSHAQSRPLYVASGTPDGELRSIVSDRGLAPLFRRVYGAPTTKRDALTTISREVGGDAADVLFIGDSRLDAEAAREAGVTFVARVTASTDDAGGVAALRVADLAELGQRLHELFSMSGAGRAC